MEFNEFVAGLVVCFLLSFILGLERQFRRRSMGLRTMILVAIGTYSFVSFSFLVTGYQIDVSRVAAQVVAGIGFLGAGVIIKDNENNKVKGLTTAATLWCDASIGVLCAGGFIPEALVATLFVLFSNVILRYLNSVINSKVENRNIDESFLVNISAKNINEIMKYVTDYVNKDSDIEAINYNVDKEQLEFNLVIKKSDEKKIDKLINIIANEFNLNKYSYKKIDETRISDVEEL